MTRVCNVRYGSGRASAQAPLTREAVHFAGDSLVVTLIAASSQISPEGGVVRPDRIGTSSASCQPVPTAA